MLKKKIEFLVSDKKLPVGQRAQQENMCLYPVANYFHILYQIFTINQNKILFCNLVLNSHLVFL